MEETLNNNQTFKAIRARQATRRFSQRDFPEDLLPQLLDAANRAPSGFNLQPWHFIVVRDPALKRLLSHVAMNQPQVLEAPATVIFVADPKAWKTSYRKVLKLGLDSGTMKQQHHDFYRKQVSLLFRTGPFGLFGFLKRLVLPLRRLKTPTPNVITSYSEAESYVRSQTMLSAATFMIAAQAAGLNTSPMEGFDEYRLKKLLKIPSRMTVPVMIAVGYQLEGDDLAQSVRLPLSEKVSIDQFGELGASFGSDSSADNNA